MYIIILCQTPDKKNQVLAKFESVPRCWALLLAELRSWER